MMQRRKLQLIAGMTYSVSLPKEWVKRHNLDEGNEVTLHERNDRELIILPEALDEKKLNEITLNVEEYAHGIGQIIFAAYYIGIETINIVSKKAIGKEVKSRIRRTLSHMSGTEIVHEDENRITIKVLLDKSRVNIEQLIYRAGIIIDMSLNALEKPDMNEIRINEDEIDRLYHLMTKIISLSLTDPATLNSSRIKNVSLLPSFFLVSKKLENLADSLGDMAEYIHRNRQARPGGDVIEFVRTELKRSISYATHPSQKLFQRTDDEKLLRINAAVLKTKDKTVARYLSDMVRYVVDIEEELVNISFYNRLIVENSL